jgi:carbon starvation protein CstA
MYTVFSAPHIIELIWFYCSYGSILASHLVLLDASHATPAFRQEAEAA